MIYSNIYSNIFTVNNNCSCFSFSLETVLHEILVNYLYLFLDPNFPYLQTVIPAWSPHHVPLAAGLLRDLVVDATAKASPDLVVRVLVQVFRQVAGALTPGDCWDHPGIWWVCLSHGSCRRPWDHEVTWLGGGRIGREGESRERQGGEMVFSYHCVPLRPLEGTTISVKVFHGPVHGFVHCGGKKQQLQYVFLYRFFSIIIEFGIYYQTLPWLCSFLPVPVKLGESETRGSIGMLECSETEVTRRWGEGIGVIGTSVT